MGQKRSWAVLYVAGHRMEHGGIEQLASHSTKSVLTKNGAIDGNTSFGAFAGSDDAKQYIARHGPGDVDSRHACTLIRDAEGADAAPVTHTCAGT